MGFGDTIYLKNKYLLLQSTPPGGSLTGNGRLSFAHPPLCAKLPLYFGNQRVIGIVNLPLDK